MIARVSLMSALWLGLALSPAHAADKYYKWVDAKGSTHYTQTPPPASKARKVLKSVTVSRHVNGSSVPGYTSAAPAATAAPTSGNAAQPNTSATSTPGTAPSASLNPSANGSAVQTGIPTVSEAATGNNTALPSSAPRAAQ